MFAGLVSSDLMGWVKLQVHIPEIVVPPACEPFSATRDVTVLKNDYCCIAQTETFLPNAYDIMTQYEKENKNLFCKAGSADIEYVSQIFHRFTPTPCS